jgi:hypothetical protein
MHISRTAVPNAHHVEPREDSLKIHRASGLTSNTIIDIIDIIS